MRDLRDVYLGDIKIGVLGFQTSEFAHSALTQTEVRECMNRALEAFRCSLIVVDENPKRPAR